MRLFPVVLLLSLAACAGELTADKGDDTDPATDDLTTDSDTVVDTDGTETDGIDTDVDTTPVDTDEPSTETDDDPWTPPGGEDSGWNFPTPGDSGFTDPGDSGFTGGGTGLADSGMAPPPGGGGMRGGGGGGPTPPPRPMSLGPLSPGFWIFPTP